MVQDAPASPAVQSVVGEVTAVRAVERSLAVRTDAGDAVVINVGEKTVLLRSRPGAKSLADATPLAFADLAPGDRVLVTGAPLPDRTAFGARRVVVMTKDDIEARHQQEREDWRRRGLSGVVVGLDPTTKEITLRLRSTPGTPTQETVVVAAEGREVAFRRYAPDSVRFSDARASSFEELQSGDQVRVLGERSEEGARILPEQVVSGAFQTVRGLVSSVDSAQGQVSLRDVEPESKRPLTVAVGQDAVLRRLPPGLADRLSGGQARGETATPPTRRGNIEDMLERLPAITLADLQPGETVAVLSTKGADPGHLTAIKLIAGLPSSTAAGAGARRRRGGAGTDLGVPSGVFDFGGDLPW